MSDCTPPTSCSGYGTFVPGVSEERHDLGEFRLKGESVRQYGRAWAETDATNVLYRALIQRNLDQSGYPATTLKNDAAGLLDSWHRGYFDPAALDLTNDDDLLTLATFIAALRFSEQGYGFHEEN